MKFWLAGLGILLLVGFPNGSFSQQGREEAAQIEEMRALVEARKLEKELQAQAIGSEISTIQTKLISIVARLEQQNQKSIEVEEHLLELRQIADQKQAALQADQTSLREILAAMQRSEMAPPPALAVTPDDMLAATRAMILLGATAPELQKRADQMRSSLVELRLLRDEISDTKADLDRQLQTLRVEQQELSQNLTTRQKLEIKLQGDVQIAAKEASSLAERAQSLQELIQQLEAEASRSTPRLKPANPQSQMHVLAPSLKPRPGVVANLPPVFHSPTSRFTDSRGQLEFPVQGAILHKYGTSPDPDQADGLVVKTSRRAQIIAPYDGRIAFVGKFRNYGHLLILDVGEGYHIICSGLSASYVVKDQTVLAGEPIGKMHDRRKPAPEFYLEFRKSGRPFDPAPWLKPLRTNG